RSKREWSSDVCSSDLVNKVYIAKIKGIPTKKELNKFKKGIASQNDILKANDATLLSADRKNNTSIIQVTLQEGKNRQVRRMFEELNYTVLKLKREKFGTLTLNGLQAGDYRPLKPHEIKQIRNLAAKIVKNLSKLEMTIDGILFVGVISNESRG